MRLSERNDKHQLIHRLHEGWRGGNGAGLIASGPAGSGKTALLRSFARITTEHGGLFVSVTASASERGHRFTVVNQLVKALRAAGMPEPFTSGDARAGPVPPEADPFASHGSQERLCRTICDFAEQRPLVIGVDDAHFADEQSLRCLTDLIRRIEWLPVIVVLTVGSGYERELTALYAETLHLTYCHRFPLVPLTLDEVAGELRRRIGDGPASRIAAFSAEVSGGNPLLLRALIEDFTAPGADPYEPEPGPAFRQAVLRCLHRTHPATLPIARAMALLGEAATPSLIVEFLTADAATLRRGILNLRAVGLLAGERFRHEETRLALLDDIPVQDLPAMHRQAAELLHGSGAPALAVAGQLVAAHDFTKGSWRVAVLREAARDAVAAGDVSDAVGYLRHARVISADAAEKAGTTAALADVQWQLDPTLAARHLRELSRNVRDGVLTGRDAMVPIRQLLWWGKFAQAEELLSAVEAEQSRDGDKSLWLNVSPETMATRLGLSFCCPGRASAASPDHPERTCDPAARQADPIAALAMLRSVLAADDADGMDKPILDDVLHVVRAGGSLLPPLFRLAALIHGDQLDEVASGLEEVLVADPIRRVPMRRATFELICAAVALRRGAVVEAGEWVQGVLGRVPPPAWGVTVGVPLALAVRAATERGELRTAASYLNVPVPPAMFQTPFALPYLQAMGRYHLAAGRQQDALAQFRSCVDLATSWSIDLPDVLDWRNDSAAALIDLREEQQARVLLEEQLAYEPDRPTRSRGVAFRLLASISDVRQRLPMLQEAVRILDACRDRLERSRAQEDLDIVREILDRRHPAPPRVVPDERPPPGHSDGVTRGIAGLTDAEQRVAALVAAGRTNREIADELFITVSTVEQHLTKVYRKLNVRGRSGLLAWLAGNP